MSHDPVLVDRLTRAGAGGVDYQALLSMLVADGEAPDATAAADAVGKAVAEGIAVRVGQPLGRVYLVGSVPGYE